MNNEANDRPDLKTGLVTLHKSTFSHLVNESDQVAMLFADQTKALVADNIWKNKKFFLVDLSANTVTPLALPSKEPLSLSKMVYAGDEILVWLTKDKQFPDEVVYAINTSGAIRELTVFTFHHLYTTDVIELQPFLDEHDSQNLSNLQTENCKLEQGSYEVLKRSIVETFYNDSIVIETNGDEVKTLLQPRTSKTIVDSCERRLPDRKATGFAVVVQRGPVANSNQSELNSRIVRLELQRAGTTVKTFDFSKGNDFYFYAVPLGQRLYLVGNAVRYFDLPEAK